MIKNENKNELRKRRKLRIKTHGTAERPRLNVYKSLNHIYAQVINDDLGTTIVSVSTLEKDVIKLIEGKTKKEAAFIVGDAVGKAAKKKNITKVMFDRSGYLYAGRVAALADGARKAGLEF